MPGDPARSVEVERKYDVDDTTALPDWSAVPGVTGVSDGEVRTLDARYLDTADAALARSGHALRRRTGGPDAGWHLKGPRTGDGRVELHWPLGEEDGVPDAVAAGIAPVRASELLPLARIENHRVAYRLAGDGGTVAEFVDDRVRAIDLRPEAQSAGAPGAGALSEWREWEFELGPAAPADPAGREALFAAAEGAIIAVGGRPAASDSKLARTLGL